LEQAFAPIKKLNDWLNEDEFNRLQPWTQAIQSLAIFLAKLPLRAVRNILNMLINIVRAAVYAVSQPLQTTTKLAKMLVLLLKALMEPGTWSRMGAGMLGATLGQAALGNPLAPIGLIIGGAMLCGGLCAGALVTAIKYRHEEGCLAEVGKAIFLQLKQCPEAFLTGFLLGLMFGAIRAQQHKATQAQQQRVHDAIEQQRYQEHLKEIEANKLAYAEQNTYIWKYS